MTREVIQNKSSKNSANPKNSIRREEIREICNRMWVAYQKDSRVADIMIEFPKDVTGFWKAVEYHDEANGTDYYDEISDGAGFINIRGEEDE